MLLRQIDFVLAHSAANQEAKYKSKTIFGMVDGNTPSVIAANFADLPLAEDVEDVDLEDAENTSKYRGPADSTVCAQW